MATEGNESAVPLSHLTDEEIEQIANGQKQKAEEEQEEEETEESSEAEGEEQAEEEGDDDAARAAALVESEDGEPATVPYSRFKEVNEDRKNLQILLASFAQNQQQAAQQQQQPAAPVVPEPEPYDFTAAAKRMARLSAEGNVDEAEAIAAEIEQKRAEFNARELEKIREQAERNAEQRVEQRMAKQSLDAAVKEVEKDYPFLNAKSPEANEAMILAVNSKAKMLVAEGMAPADAVREAASKMVKAALKLSGKPKAADPAATDPRTKEAIERGSAVRQGATPGKGIGAAGKDAGRLSIHDLSDKDLDNPDVVARLTGKDKIR